MSTAAPVGNFEINIFLKVQFEKIFHLLQDLQKLRKNLFVYSSRLVPNIRYFIAAKTFKIGLIFPIFSSATKSTTISGLPSIFIIN